MRAAFGRSPPVNHRRTTRTPITIEEAKAVIAAIEENGFVPEATIDQIVDDSGTGAPKAKERAIRAFEEQVA